MNRLKLYLLLVGCSAFWIIVVHLLIGGTVGTMVGLVTAAVGDGIIGYCWVYHRRRRDRQHHSLQATDTLIPDAIAAEVWERAIRLQQNQQSQTYTLAELTQAGSEADIAPALIQQALRDIQAQQQQRQQQQQRLQQRLKQAVAISFSSVTVLLVWVGWTYNSLNQAAAVVDTQWAQVENQRQRRADLLPQLIALTETSIEQKDVLVPLLQAQAAYQKATTVDEKANAIAHIDQAIAHLQTVASKDSQRHNNPSLSNLQYEMIGTENRIFVERMRYNQAVQTYNQKITEFPTGIVAHMFGFQSHSQLKTD